MAGEATVENHEAAVPAGRNYCLYDVQSNHGFLHSTIYCTQGLDDCHIADNSHLAYIQFPGSGC